SLSSASAIWRLSSTEKSTPSVCAPSRSVVSKRKSLSLLIACRLHREIGGVPIVLRRGDGQQSGHVCVRVDALFEHGGDHRAEIALFGEHQPDPGLLRPHRAGAAAMFEAVAIAAWGAHRLRQHNCVTGFGPPLPPPGGGPLARRAQSRRAKRVGPEVGRSGRCGHFGRISPKQEQRKNNLEESALPLREGRRAQRSGGPNWLFPRHAPPRNLRRANFDPPSRGGWERAHVEEARSLLHFPGRALRTVLQHDALGEKLVADAVGLGEVLGLARGETRFDGAFDGGGIDRLLALERFGLHRKTEQRQPASKFQRIGLVQLGYCLRRVEIVCKRREETLADLLIREWLEGVVQ